MDACKGGGNLFRLESSCLPALRDGKLVKSGNRLQHVAHAERELLADPARNIPASRDLERCIPYSE